jgi:hypothetical protein
MRQRGPAIPDAEICDAVESDFHGTPLPVDHSARWPRRQLTGANTAVNTSGGYMSPRRREFLMSSAALLASGTARPRIIGSERVDAERGRSRSSRSAGARSCGRSSATCPWQHTPARRDVGRHEKHDGYTLQRLVLDLNGVEPVPACSDSGQAANARSGPAVHPLARRHVRPRQGAAPARRGRAARPTRRCAWNTDW